jgi:hypothetical protein
MLPPCCASPLAQAVEAFKVIHTKSNGVTAANNHPAETHEETLLALFTLAGHVAAHRRCDHFTVCKSGHPRFVQDLFQLHAFALSLGVSHV